MAEPSMSDSLITTPLVVVAVVFPVLASAAVALRFYARRIKRQDLKADDWVILLGLLMCWAISINTLVAAGEAGVDTTQLPPLTAAVIYLKALWIEGIPLSIGLAVIKISILLFYARIFITRPFRICVNIMVGVLSAWGLSSVLVLIFGAKPISTAWNPLAPPSDIKISFASFSQAIAGMSILFDVMVLCFPIPVIKSLHMETRRKVFVAGIFWLGSFCCVAAAVRFYYLHQVISGVTSSRATTFSYQTSSFIWSHIEPNCSVIAACLPTYGPFFTGESAESFFRSVKSFLSLSSILSARSRSRSRNSDKPSGDESLIRKRSEFELAPSPDAGGWHKLDRSNHSVDVVTGPRIGAGEGDLEAGTVVAPREIAVTRGFGSEFQQR